MYVCVNVMIIDSMNMFKYDLTIEVPGIHGVFPKMPELAVVEVVDDVMMEVAAYPSIPVHFMPYCETTYKSLSTGYGTVGGPNLPSPPSSKLKKGMSDGGGGSFGNSPSDNFDNT